MSWKYFVTASLLCALASPAFAAPTVTVTKGGAASNGNLDLNGNWVWKVQISNSNPVPATSSPLAAELGFKETATNGALIGASALNPVANFDTVNPGTAIWGWELPGTGTNNKPEGIQTNCASGCTVNVPGDDPNAVFAALGSIDFNTVGPHDFITVVVRGPAAAAGRSLTTSLAMSGAYAGKGRVAEATGPTTAINYDTFSGAFTRTAKLGDATLGGGVDDTDLAQVLLNFGTAGGWNRGNFNGDALIDDTDLANVLLNFGQPSDPSTLGAGAGLGSGGGVPEPASAALVGLALLGGLGLIGRKR